MCRKFYSKVWLSSFFCLIFSIGYNLYGKGIDVAKLDNGWVCSGPIQYSIRSPEKNPILCDQSIVVLEKYIKKSSPRNFYHHKYYLTILNISDGSIIDLNELLYEKHPVQVLAMWPCKKNVVIWGYYQNNPGLSTKIPLIRILDLNGNIIKEFEIDSAARPMAIDRKNNLLLCKYRSSKNETKEVDSTNMGILIYDLDSCRIKFKKQLDGLFGIVADEDGNAYLLRRGAVDVNKGLFETFLEKYSVDPWKFSWSTSLKSINKKYPIRFRYQKGMLWYALYNITGGFLEWVDIPIDAQTGLEEKMPYQFTPYLLVEIKGVRYKIKWEGSKLYILEYPTSNSDE